MAVAERVLTRQRVQEVPPPVSFSTPMQEKDKEGIVGTSVEVDATSPYRHSEEVRRRISAAIKGRPKPERSEEHRLHMSIARGGVRVATESLIRRGLLTRDIVELVPTVSAGQVRSQRRLLGVAETTDEGRREALRVARRRRERVHTEEEERTVAFVRTLLRKGALGKDEKEYEKVEAFYRQHGRPFPDFYADRLALEGFFIARTAAVEERARLLMRYRRMARAHHPNVFTTSLAEEIRFIGRTLHSKAAKEAKPGTIRTEIMSLCQRGFTVSEITTITSLRARQVRGAVRNMRRCNLLPTEQTSQTNRMAALARHRSRGSFSYTPDEKKSLFFARKLWRAGLVPKEKTLWDRLERLYARNGRELPVSRTDRLRLEVFFFAHLEQKRGNKKPLRTFIRLGSKGDTEWYEQLVDEHYFISEQVDPIPASGIIFEKKK